MELYDKVRKKDWEKGRYLTRNKWGDVVDERGGDWLFNPRLVWDEWEEYVPILSKKEKEYLGAVIKPFRDRVVYIRKVEAGECNQFISIKVKRYDYDEEDSHEYIDLPYFREDTMYKNMEVGKDYTLKELGL